MVSRRESPKNMHGQLNDDTDDILKKITSQPAVHDGLPKGAAEERAPLKRAIQNTNIYIYIYIYIKTR